MKYIKASICSIAAFSVLPYIHSAENLDLLLDEIKQTRRADPVLSKIERDESINQGFEEIENKIFNGDSLPQPLKYFYQEVGNYNFNVEILSPIKGVTSPLNDGIRKGQEKAIPSEWVVFGQIDECEYFCINRFNPEVARFLVPPEPFKQVETYPNLEAWIAKILLRKK